MGLREVHSSVIADASLFIDRLTPAHLTRPSNCPPWSVPQLLAHMIGQNRGVARTVRGGSFDADDYLPAKETTPRIWRLSASDVSEAIADTPLDWQVDGGHAGEVIPVQLAVQLHLLEVAVHLWDLATSIGKTYDPGAEALTELTTLLDAGEVRPLCPSGQAFAPPVQGAGADPWSALLGRLGRAPGEPL